ncbi:MAG: DUF1015 domain-containing protein [Sphaerobacteraceae bacterium]|nr:MAG: DUF1015 domain-containing protein [Sphaerobacteraceae bacterium]
MPKIEPFCGVHYDPQRTFGLSPVIGPPQDLPNLEEASRLIEQHPYHSLRLELGDPEAGNWAQPDQVRASVFERWIADGLLIRPEQPAFFVHEHRYRQNGIYHRRLGLFAAASLEESASTGFRPHEGTIPGNLRFRVDLLRQLRLSISPIFTLIRDSGWLGVVLADLVHARPPDLSGHDNEDGVHRLWTLTDPHLIAWLQDLMAERPLYIADGHHRFAAAKAYRDHLLEQGQDPGPAGSVLTLIVSEFDPGVSILPIHREIREIPGDHHAMQERLEELFEIECVLQPEQIDPDLVARRTRRLAESASEQPEFLMIRHDDQRLCRLRLKESVSLGRFIEPSTAPEVGDLDVTVLHRVILEHVLAIPRDDPDNLIIYSADAATLTRRVQAGTSPMALFMTNPRIEQVLAVADAGAYMPQKSTYFYPKVPAGLIIYDLG